MEGNWELSIWFKHEFIHSKCKPTHIIDHTHTHVELIVMYYFALNFKAF